MLTIYIDDRRYLYCQNIRQYVAPILTHEYPQHCSVCKVELRPLSYSTRQEALSYTETTMRDFISDKCIELTPGVYKRCCSTVCKELFNLTPNLYLDPIKE